MATHTVKTNLKGMKKWAWRKNLNGFFSVNGQGLTDAQVRKMVHWAIEKGYEYDADIPVQEITDLLNVKNYEK
jgi:tRNA U38,U39,U40 pseudouridine synthase TruA